MIIADTVETIPETATTTAMDTQMIIVDTVETILEREDNVF